VTLLKIVLYAIAAVGWLGATLHVIARTTDGEPIEPVGFGACIATGLLGMLLAGSL
jgi:hypothetical protein